MGSEEKAVERPEVIFDVDLCAAYVETLIHLDEVERALIVLNNLPAYYRDNYPPQLKLLKESVLAALCTTHAYITSNLDCDVNPAVSPEWIPMILRGVLILNEVKRYNEAGLVPHLVDVGPGEYHVPIGLRALGARFTYKAIAVDVKAAAMAAPHIAGLELSDGVEPGPLIFIAHEIIEHLPSTQDLAVECLRHCGGWPERIHLSTPCYTFDTKIKDWKKPCGLPHLRAYTPNEFVNEASKLFPGFSWQMYKQDLISLRGMREDLVDAKPLL